MNLRYYKKDKNLYFKKGILKIQVNQSIKKFIQKFSYQKFMLSIKNPAIDKMTRFWYNIIQEIHIDVRKNMYRV